MISQNRNFFATLGIVLTWLFPLVVFFLFLSIPPVRDLLTGFAFLVAIYASIQFYRWGNQGDLRPITQPRTMDSRARINIFLDSLTNEELRELHIQVQMRLGLSPDQIHEAARLPESEQQP